MSYLKTKLVLTHLLRVLTEILFTVLFEIGRRNKYLFKLSNRQLKQRLMKHYLIRDKLNALATFDEAFPHFWILPDLFTDETLHHNDHKTAQLGIHCNRLNNFKKKRRNEINMVKICYNEKLIFSYLGVLDYFE